MAFPHTDAQIAKIAYTLARRDTQSLGGTQDVGDGLDLPEHLLEEAAFWLGQAKQVLKDAHQGYDPEEHAVGKGEDAVVEYVRLKLIGKDPDTANSFQQKRQSWAHAAAVAYHDGYTERYPDYPDVNRRRRMRDHSFKEPLTDADP